MVFESKYAESVKDWKTYSSLSGVQLWYFQEDLRLCVAMGGTGVWRYRPLATQGRVSGGRKL